MEKSGKQGYEMGGGIKSEIYPLKKELSIFGCLLKTTSDKAREDE